MESGNCSNLFPKAYDSPDVTVTETKNNIAYERIALANLLMAAWYTNPRYWILLLANSLDMDMEKLNVFGVIE